ncbi:MAG: DNA/RNA non-specific endonuclease [Cyanobacteria bacterium P01_A01_bin.40]
MLIPNNETVNNTDWEDYITTVVRIEQVTGYDFFSNLEDSLESKIESRVY